MKERRKRRLIISSMAIILIASTPVTIFLTLYIFDLRNTTYPFGEYDFPNFYLEEPFLYVVHGRERLLVFNNSNYQQLQLLGDLVLKDHNRAPLTKYGNYLFLFRHENYFGEIPDIIYYIEIVDVSDPHNPQLIAEQQLPIGYPASFRDTYNHEFIEIDNELYFFMKDEDLNSFLVINCTNMHQPTFLDSYQFPGEASTDFNKLHKFYIRDKLIFFPTLNTTSSNGITIYNITTLDNFTKIGEWFGDINLESFDSIYATKEYLYLKKRNSGVEAFNIQNLTHPTRIGFVTGVNWAYICHKNYVLGFTSYSFNIYDCSITNYTVPINNYTYPDIANTYIHYSFLDENKITDNYIYLPFWIHTRKNETLHIWDWSDPYNLSIKVKIGMPRIPSLRELSWTYKKVITPIIIGDAIIATLGIILLRGLKVKKKE